MSFFGFDATLPRDRSQDQQGGGGFFGSRQDPFGGYSKDDGDGKILDFDDTYDGLGNALDETGDDLNDDTFGDGGKVGKDFDFSGQTQSARPVLKEEEALHYARQPPPRASTNYAQAAKPARSGYESYREPDYIPQLEASASIWGLPAKKAPEPAATAIPEQARKFMSVEEVEAAMRAQAPQVPPAQQQPFPPQQPQASYASPSGFQQQQQQAHPGQSQQFFQQPPNAGLPPMQILHNPAHQQQHPQGFPQQPPFPQQGHARGASVPQAPMAQHMSNLSEQQKQMHLADEAKRAKRNHKIFLLSKHNGIMTPQDKNFITRIQLQQLMAASERADEANGEAQLAEDFYCQVYSHIRGAPRQDPNQPLNHFARTYLHQTGGRYGNGRRNGRGGDNHVQRMEQQVQRAVEAAKARPKNKQLTVEGSLGKIAFSNSKTPRPLLSFKRQESEAKLHGKGVKVSVADRKATLRDIEDVYSLLMQVEDHERALPPPPTEESNPGAIQRHIEWRERHQELNEKLWWSMRVMEPIQDGSSTPHPFIAILSHPKGKKLIPRVFRHLDEQQRTTLLTITVLHLDILDVIRQAYPQPEDPRLPPHVRDAVDLFSNSVMPPLFSYVNDAPLSIISGLLGLIADRVNVQTIVRTKIGVSMLTMLISRAELIKQSNSNGGVSEDDWTQFTALYARLFDLIEPVLPYIFSMEPVTQSEDVHVWQFLAAMGVGATAEQQQRLVLGVKDRVMETVGVAKTLPQDMGVRKLGEVNLFMRAIGLDVDLLG